MESEGNKKFYICFLNNYNIQQYTNTNGENH